MEQRNIYLKTILINILICVALNLATVIYCKTLVAMPNNVTQEQTVNINTSTEEAKDKINLNTASQEELESLPTVGEKTAEQIIKNRPYNSIYDLKKIKGIGDKTIDAIKEVTTVK